MKSKRSFNQQDVEAAKKSSDRITKIIHRLLKIDDPDFITRLSDQQKSFFRARVLLLTGFIHSLALSSSVIFLKDRNDYDPNGDYLDFDSERFIKYLDECIDEALEFSISIEGSIAEAEKTLERLSAFNDIFRDHFGVK